MGACEIRYMSSEEEEEGDEFAGYGGEVGRKVGGKKFAVFRPAWRSEDLSKVGLVSPFTLTPLRPVTDTMI